MKILKTAVVGLGRIGWQFHIPEIIRHEGFELAAVVDPLAERLDEAKAQFNAKGYTDYLEMLNKEKPDLVVIASPTPFHFPQTLAAFERGIDVFLEKPMVPTVEEADRMIEKMKQTGRKLMIYQPHRITPELLAAQSIIESGILGGLYMVKRAISAYQRRNDWQSQKKFGGGMLNNHGAHYIDQLLYLTSSTAKSVSCSLRKIAALGDADDVVKALIETQNSIILDLDINMAAALPLPMFILMGSCGTAALERNSQGQSVFKIRYYKEDELKKDIDVHTEFAAPGRSYSNLDDKIIWYEKEINTADFSGVRFYDKCYDYFALDKKSFVPVTETREVLRVMNKCREVAGW